MHKGLRTPTYGVVRKINGKRFITYQVVGQEIHFVEDGCVALHFFCPIHITDT